MKKILTLFLFLLCLSTCSINQCNASSQVETDTLITFTDEEPSMLEIQPTEPPTQLLKTGEVLNSFYPLIGLIFILLVLLIKEKRKE